VTGDWLGCNPQSCRQSRAMICPVSEYTTVQYVPTHCVAMFCILNMQEAISNFKV